MIDMYASHERFYKKILLEKGKKIEYE
jgi:hypothetical protein